MAKKGKGSRQIYLTIWWSILLLLTWIFIFANGSGGRGPTESYVSAETVRLNGKIYYCGTITTTTAENLDDESLYCRGYKEGYAWATTQADMDQKHRDYIGKVISESVQAELDAQKAQYNNKK